MSLRWIWLDVVLVDAERGNSAEAVANTSASAGRLGAAAYFYCDELPKISAWLQVVASRDMTCADLSETVF